VTCVSALSKQWKRGRRGVRRPGEKPPALLVEHFEPEGFALPVIVTVIDQDSEYRGLTIDVDKIKGPH
jgi:hypothetical protein